MARSSAARAEVPQLEKPKRAKAKERSPVSARKEKPPKKVAIERGAVVDFMGGQASVAEIIAGDLYLLESKATDMELEQMWFVSADELLAGKTASSPKLEKVKPLSEQPEVAQQLREAAKEELRQSEEALIQLRTDRETLLKRLAKQPGHRVAMAGFEQLTARMRPEQKRWRKAFLSLNPTANAEYAFLVAEELTGNGVLFDAQVAGLTTPEKIHEKIIQLTDVIEEYEFKPAAALLTQEIEKLKTIEQGYKAAPERLKKSIEAIRIPKIPSELRRDPSYLKLWAKWSALPESDLPVFLEFINNMADDTPEGHVYEQFGKDRRELAEVPVEKTFANAGVAIELGLTPAGLDQLHKDFEDQHLQTIVGFTWNQFMNPTVEAPKGFFGKLFKKPETVEGKRQKMLDAILETGAQITPTKKAA